MEIWKDIKGYKGVYQVSNLGRIKSMDKILYNKRKKKYNVKNGRVRKLDGLNKDYYQITLHLNGKLKKYLVHRLVAMTFITNPNNYPEVNHLNCRKKDNKASNLEWTTPLLNAKHAKAKGKYDGFPNGIKKPNAILSEDAIIHIRKMEFRNIEYCKLYGVMPSTICGIQTNPKRWRHVKCQ